jgi:hypothetical protein
MSTHLDQFLHQLCNNRPVESGEGTQPLPIVAVQVWWD